MGLAKRISKIKTPEYNNLQMEIAKRFNYTKCTVNEWDGNVAGFVLNAEGNTEYKILPDYVFSLNYCVLDLIPKMKAYLEFRVEESEDADDYYIHMSWRDKLVEFDAGLIYPGEDEFGDFIHHYIPIVFYKAEWEALAICKAFTSLDSWEVEEAGVGHA